jgi:hypothetical protein
MPFRRIALIESVEARRLLTVLAPEFTPHVLAFDDGRYTPTTEVHQHHAGCGHVEAGRDIIHLSEEVIATLPEDVMDVSPQTPLLVAPLRREQGDLPIAGELAASRAGGSGSSPGDWDLVINFFSSGLSGPQTSDVQASIDEAERRWENILLGDLDDVFVGGRFIDDLEIDLSVVPIDGGGGILGQAGPTSFRSSVSSTPFLPSSGIVQLDTADVSFLIDERGGEALTETLFHEIGHVAGLTPTLWDFSFFSLLSGASGSNPTYTGTAAIAEYNTFRNFDAASIPTEVTNSTTRLPAHWRENVFGPEIMSPALNTGQNNVVSRMTVAGLIDLGYPDVDLDATEPYNLPLNTAAGNANRNFLPTIDSLTASLSGGTLDLTANNVADSNNDVERVEFWLDTNGREGLQRGTSNPDTFLGQDTSDAGGWSLSTSAASLPGGDLTLFARAFDLRNLGSEDVVATTDNAGDSTPPQLLTGSFEFDTTQRIDLTFSEPINLASGSFTLFNDTLGQAISPTRYEVLVVQPGRTELRLEVDLPEAGPWESGLYTLTVNPGALTDDAGNPSLQGTFDFFVLAGDANRDRTVNLSDFLVLRRNFGSTGVGFSQGDFNYDDTVNLSDFLVLRRNFGTTLPAASPPSLFGDGGDDDGPGGGSNAARVVRA